MGRKKSVPKKVTEHLTTDVREVALRIYVNESEQRLIEAAVAKTMRVPKVSRWAGKVLLKHACEILQVPYPYPEE